MPALGLSRGAKGKCWMTTTGQGIVYLVFSTYSRVDTLWWELTSDSFTLFSPLHRSIHKPLPQTSFSPRFPIFLLSPRWSPPYAWSNYQTISYNSGIHTAISSHTRWMTKTLLAGRISSHYCLSGISQVELQSSSNPFTACPYISNLYIHETSSAFFSH